MLFRRDGGGCAVDSVRSLPLALLLLVPLAVAQQTSVVPEPRELPMCDVPTPVLFATNEAGIENLVFDGNGSLFLTAFDAGLYQAFPNGTVRFVTKDTRAIPSTNAPNNGPNAFMGIDVGPDGALYVAEGLSITAPVDARVLRFAIPGQPEFEVYADGFDGANGLAFAGDGALYLAHGFRSEVWRIAAPNAWGHWLDLPGANGVVKHPDGRIVIGQIGDPAQGVAAYDTTTKASERLFTFNPGATAVGNEPAVGGTDGALMTKGIDDFVVLDDGRIVAAAHLRLQFLLGDPATGQACIILDGARAEPTSARVAKGFGEWDGWVFLTDNAGDIHAVDLRTSTAASGSPSDTVSPGDEPVGTPGPGAAMHVLALVCLAVFARRRA